MGSDRYTATSPVEYEHLAGTGLFSQGELLRMLSMTTPQLIFPGEGVGCLEPGCRADILALERDPLVDTAALRSIRTRVMSGLPLEPESGVRNEAERGAAYNPGPPPGATRILKKSDFHFDLPVELIAQAPLPERSASRLLVLPPAPAELADRGIRDLPDLLAPGDLLVFNDTRVLPARLFGQKSTGGRVEILVERVLGANEARVQIGASKPSRTGTRILLDAGGEAEVLGREGEFYRLQVTPPAGHEDESIEKLLLRAGRLPLPPYITRDAELADAERYQTVFARETGAVAAPTAGLHFDQPLLDALRNRGVEFGHVTLHVGAGTFQPMRVESVHEHRMHSEWLNVGAELVEQVRRTRARGGRVVAVGTTVVRALESAMRDGELLPYAGETTIFIFPGYRVRSVDAMVTNFHLPESTLLMLVSAFAGRERVLAAYNHAVAQRYRFFSYGDAMLVFPGAEARG